LLSGEIKSIPQDKRLDTETTLKAAPKIFKETTCRIDWAKTSCEINNLIRGLSPHPAAWSELHTPEGEVIPVKIYASHIKFAQLPKMGAIHTDNKAELAVGCSDGWVYIDELQFPSKKRMKTEDFLRGYKFRDEAYFN
jgi:methionyl-tRNA formyltransferase